jgi:hypothetical protein
MLLTHGWRGKEEFGKFLSKGYCGQVTSPIAGVSPTEQGLFSMTDALEAYWSETEFLTPDELASIPTD